MKVNDQRLLVGPPEYGKTTLMRTIVREKLDEGLNVFAHDPNLQFRDLCAKYESPAAWKTASAAAAAAGAELPKGAAFWKCEYEEVRDLVCELGERHNHVDSIRYPMFFVTDEGSLMEDSGSSFASKEDKRLMANRRHNGVGLMWNIQDPTMLVRRFWDLATDVYLFQQPLDRQRLLEQRLSLNPGTLAGLDQLPPFKFLHWSRSHRGLV